MKKRWLIRLITVLLIGVAIGALIWRGRAATPAPAPAATASAASKVETDAIAFAGGAPQLAMIRSEVLPAVALPFGESLNARVVYDEDMTARVAPAVAGRVVAIKAKVGERVHRGQLLAEINAPDFGAALADLDKARADEERKRKAMRRAEELVAGEGIAGKDDEAARADYAQAHAETVRARQRVDNLNPGGLPTSASGARLALRSPIDGVLVERNVTPALEVAPGGSLPLFVISQLKQLWLSIDVPEATLARIVPGARVDVESDAYPGEHFTAHIIQTGQSIDPNTRRVVARALLDNSSGKLLPEMFVRAAIVQGGAPAVRVPNNALVNSGLYNYLFVETAPGQFRRRRVNMLSRGADASYVGDGASGGDRVVTTGALLLDAEMGSRTGSAP